MVTLRNMSWVPNYNYVNSSFTSNDKHFLLSSAMDAIVYLLLLHLEISNNSCLTRIYSKLSNSNIINSYNVIGAGSDLPTILISRKNITQKKIFSRMIIL